MEPHQDILSKAEEVEKSGIKGNDAVHLSCGLFSNCHYFVTCDDKVIRRSAFLDMSMVVCSPLEFIRKEASK